MILRRPFQIGQGVWPGTRDHIPVDREIWNGAGIAEMIFHGLEQLGAERLPFTCTVQDLLRTRIHQKVRNVPAEIKREVCEEYGITWHDPGDYG
jgi:hypothetical protein